MLFTLTHHFTSENTYIFEKNNNCIIIDPGYKERIIHFLKQKDFKVEGILLTHGHYDHIEGVDTIVKEFHCPVYCSEETKRIATDPDLNLSIYSYPFIIHSDITVISDSINLLNTTIQCISNPGHTSGDYSYYIEEENIMFTGDFLFKNAIGRYDFPTSSIENMKTSIRKFKDYSINPIIYPGHGPSSTLTEEKTQNPYFQ